MDKSAPAPVIIIIIIYTHTYNIIRPGDGMRGHAFFEKKKKKMFSSKSVYV